MNNIAITRALRVSSFRFLWLAQVFSQIGINLLSFVLAIRVYDLTGKNTAVSVLVLALAIPAAVLGMLAGVLVDRWDKKMVLFSCNALRALAAIGFIFFHQSLAAVYVLAIFIAVITQFFVPAEAPMIPGLVNRDNLLPANSLFTLTIFSTMLIGGLLAGPLLILLGISGTFVIITLLFALAAAAIVQIPGGSVKAFVKRRFSRYQVKALSGGLRNGIFRELRLEFWEGHDYILSHRRVFGALVLLVSSQTIIATFSTLLPGMAVSILKIAVTDASVLLLGPAILGILLGAALISQIGHRVPRKKIVNFGVISVAVCLSFLGILTNLHMAQSLLLLLGFANGLVDVSSNTTLQEETTEEIRSRVYGILTSLSGIVYFLPVIFSGVLSDIFGIEKVLIAGGCLLFLLWLFKIRQFISLL